ncbi:Membrane protein implicated in regulation of membrane protease activity [Duganella sp. CF402]|uniref:NfeD family protein n=1 Tax=unclassified Duganella TaxID=2636909 RepID=UPI0008BCC08B|nr:MULTISPECIES: NfeD family protein [unclassified Duganella]RZT10155.1 membrane protein implicated in regulation of membrane protease activity [Duganella sp. BK701]SEL25767.1 Membrane protein implicated in regulation of membrane protease activity [Duganella sp. CF402]
MADWSYWLAAAGLTVILELFSGTFYLLMIAIGLAAGSAAALLGLGEAVQLLVAAVVGVAATVALRRSRYGKQQERVDAGRDPNVNLDIGQTVHVPAWQDNAARVMYRGALWDVELAPGVRATPGQFTIREVRGSRLIVAA